MKLLDILKLAKQMQKFVETKTDCGLLICDGELEVGKDVFLEDEEVGVIPAADGEYVAEDKVIVVVEGKVAEINENEVAPEVEPEPEPEAEPEQEPESEPEPENEPEKEPEPEAEPEAEPADDKDAKIAELEAKIAELEAENADLKAQLDGAKEELSKPVKTETKLNGAKSPFKSYFKN